MTKTDEIIFRIQKFNTHFQFLHHTRVAQTKFLFVYKKENNG